MNLVLKLNLILLYVKNNNFNTYIIIPTHLLEAVLKNQYLVRNAHILFD